MFSNLATKIALKKVGLSADTFNFGGGSTETKKSSKNAPAGSVPGLDDVDDSSSSWPAWMSVKALPLTVQPWLSPPPPPIAVSECPKKGDLAPLDRDRKLTFGGGRPTLVVFLRCVGCAFAQKTFLNLRTIANRFPNLRCIAVSHSSAHATQKWIDLLGGAWAIEVVIDEDRAVYAAWGLGLGSVWYVFNPTSQSQSWKEKGWLGEKVAGAIQRTNSGLNNRGSGGANVPRYEGNGAGVVDTGDAPSTVMGNKWQTAGAFAVDGRGTVIWGGKALRMDDVLDLDAGAASLGF